MVTCCGRCQTRDYVHGLCVGVETALAWSPDRVPCDGYCDLNFFSCSQCNVSGENSTHLRDAWIAICWGSSIPTTFSSQRFILKVANV